MCCTIGAEQASLTGTKIYAGEAVYNKKYVHVLAYQNLAETISPNAMVIPFPTNQPMTKENVIDVSGFHGFLKDIGEATRHRTKGFSRGLAASADMLSFSAEVFDHGSYTVILATHVGQIPEALKRVDESKRPTINTQFLLRYSKMYPNQPIAVCCWKGSIVPEPLLWWYEPTDKSTLFIPTMDAHDGSAPDVNAMVSTDHVISIGSNIERNGSRVNYTETLSAQAEALLPKMVHGHRTPALIKNGDMFVSIDQMKAKTKYGNVMPMIKRGSDANHFHYEGHMDGWS